LLLLLFLLILARALGWGLTLALVWLPALSEAEGLDDPLPQAARAQGAIHYVAPLGDCGGADPCYTTVQAAVDAANNGDDIRVAGGTYTGVSARQSVTQVVYISKTVTIRGGYTTGNWDTADPDTNLTILDAQGQGRVLYITGEIRPTIEGLRITGGNAFELGGHPGGKDAGGGVYISTASASISNSRVYDNIAQYGGGLYLNSSAATLTGNRVQGNTAQALWEAGSGGGLYLYHSSDANVAGNRVEDNTASGYWGGTGGGGGLYLDYSDAVLSGNTITANTTYFDGGGLYLYHSDGTLRGNTIVANTADFNGGGLYLDESDAKLSGNTVTSNTAFDDGGGLYLEESDATLINNLVADDQANGLGSGLYIGGSSPRLLHTTIARNADGDGSGVYVTNSGSSYSTVALTNTILVSHTVGITVAVGNTARLEATLWGTDTWANVTDWGGAGTIITGTVNHWGDPAFVDPEAGDYHIGPSSSAVDAGVNAGVRTDVDNEPRPYQTPDLGADEYWAPGALKRMYLPLVVRNR